MNTRARIAGGNADASDARVRQRAPQERHLQHARQPYVADILPAASACSGRTSLRSSRALCLAFQTARSLIGAPTGTIFSTSCRKESCPSDTPVTRLACESAKARTCTAKSATRWGGGWLTLSNAVVYDWLDEVL
jgi:hypothetical protein